MIVFTQHAILKLKHRSIRKEFVIQTLKKPDRIIDSYKDRKTAFKKFKKIYMKVIFRNEKNNIIIITQHWTNKII